MSAPILGQTGLPHVNLLPPEISAARGLKAVKRMLALGLIAVVVLCSGGYLVAALQQQKADEALSDAQSAGQKLEQQKLTYAQVPIIKRQLTDTGSALAMGMSSEIDWAGYTSAVVATLPEGVSLTSLKVSYNATPVDSATNPIYASSIGQIEFTGRSLTVPDSQAWLTQLATVPGFVDPLIATMTVAGTSTEAYYETTASVRFTNDALTHRFDNSAQEAVAP